MWQQIIVVLLSYIEAVLYRQDSHLVSWTAKVCVVRMFDKLFSLHGIGVFHDGNAHSEYIHACQDSMRGLQTLL